VNVLEEAGFKIIISSVLESLGLEGVNFKIKDAFEKGYGEEVILNRPHTLNFLKGNFIVLVGGHNF